MKPALSVIHGLMNKGNQLERRIRQRRANPERVSVPCFLFGNGRSGTSMIVFRLAKTWEIDLYNENHPDAFENYLLRSLDEVAGLVARSHARVTLFKPIKDTFRAARIMERFPNARALFAFRHVDDVANSARKRFHSGVSHAEAVHAVVEHHPVREWVATDFAAFAADPPPDTTKDAILSLWRPELNLYSHIALHWLFMNRLFLDRELDRDHRIMLVQYEKIVRDPVTMFSRICRHLGIEFHPRMAEGVFDSSLRKQPAPPLDPPIRVACESLWEQLCSPFAEPRTS